MHAAALTTTQLKAARSAASRVIAYPAKYANSGVMTFIVNHDGVVYEKDLGPDTANVARAITRFDPGPGWKALSIQMMQCIATQNKSRCC